MTLTNLFTNSSQNMKESNIIFLMKEGEKHG